MEHVTTVNIRPGVNILSILKHIEYEPWYALAEFVDNAIDSYLKHKEELKKIEGNSYKLRVRIEFNDVDKKISIKDNAAGIQERDYARAFRAAEIPPDNTGLSEFGMGMKTAACWFSDKWSVRTSAIYENYRKDVFFDLNKIYHDKLEELEVTVKPESENRHYTFIELSEIGKMPVKKTRAKIKEHLSSIYRYFFRENILNLYVDDELLEYKEPAILNAPPAFGNTTQPIYWKKDINFEIEKGRMYVKGFVAIRETMSNSETGFASFRRGRVIEGSVDEGFKPKEIMGELGSPEYKRIFGELYLEGFDVSFTKKGIKWDENMDMFLQLLKSDLTHSSFPLIKQAREFRVKPTKADQRKAAEAVVRSTVSEFRNTLQPALSAIRQNPIPATDDANLNTINELAHREFEINFNNTRWLITIELSYDSTVTDWIEVGSHVLRNKNENGTVRQVGVRMSLNHPFVTHFAGTDKSKLEPILRIAAALGLAEETAREAGVSKAGTIRINLNKLITAISKS